MEINEEKYILKLKATFNSYSNISEKSWLLIQSRIQFQSIEKGDIILRAGKTAKNVYFICKGIVRTYFTNAQGTIYTKNIFLENSFPASKVSLLLSEPSKFSIEALEDCTLIKFNFKLYKNLIEKNEDLKNFYIAYIEQNWIIEKELKEISIVLENATERYLNLLESYPNIDKRIEQRHIASHLGITPTQLSRIRKKN